MSHFTELLGLPNTEICEKLASNVFGRVFGGGGPNKEHLMHKATIILLNLFWISLTVSTDSSREGEGVSTTKLIKYVLPLVDRSIPRSLSKYQKE